MLALEADEHALVVTHGHRGVEVYCLVLLVDECLDVALDGVGRIEDAEGALERDAPCVVEHDITANAVEELRAKLIFESVEASAEARLRHMEALCGLREILAFGYDAKVF